MNHADGLDAAAAKLLAEHGKTPTRFCVFAPTGTPVPAEHHGVPVALSAGGSGEPLYGAIHDAPPIRDVMGFEHVQQWAVRFDPER